jgi:hypothetical protein
MQKICRDILWLGEEMESRECWGFGILVKYEMILSGDDGM